LSPWTYKNLVGVALRLKEFNWVEKFIKDYNKLLAEEFRDNALNYNLAELFYYKHDYDSAMIYLNKVEFSDIYYSLDTKKMMMKIYFEQNTIDPLLSLISSFKIFIRRNKSVSDTNKQAYDNFITVIQQFLKYQNQKKVSALKRTIENIKPLADRNWLIEQYNMRFID
jgi:tetratricopeptide (TPR) repeat protein